MQSMTATRDTHESMHALVDKVQIAILVADQRERWPTLAFLDGRGQVPALVPSPCLGADCVGNTTRKKERCPQASGPK